MTAGGAGRWRRRPLRSAGELAVLAAFLGVERRGDVAVAVETWRAWCGRFDRPPVISSGSPI